MKDLIIATITLTTMTIAPFALIALAIWSTTL